MSMSATASAVAGVKQEPSEETDDEIVVYKEEVLGKRVEILFANEATGDETFYAGTIREFKVKLNEGGVLVMEHFIEFDDGDKGWFILGEEEKDGRLLWKKPLAASLNQLKQEDEEDDIAPPTPTSACTKKRKHGETTPELKETVKEEVDSDSASEEEEEEIVVPDPLPDTMKKIIQFMDKLEPGKDYFRRQMDTRGECSGIRGKLRKFARKNPTNKAVRHWIETAKWQPPDQKSLFALMELIKTMIK